MEFKKERNYVVAYDNNTMLGKWDIISGQFIGKSGKPVVSVPRAFVLSNLDYYTAGMSTSKMLGAAVRFYREKYNDGCLYNEQIGKRFEELLSVGLFPSDGRALTDKTRLTKKVVEYCKVNRGGWYDKDTVKQFTFREKYDFLNNHPDWFVSAFVKYYKDYPEEFLKNFLLRAEREHVIDFWELNKSYYFERFLKNYYSKAKLIYGEVKVTPNLLSNYAHISKIDKEVKDKRYDELLKQNNDKDFLYYQNDKYIAFPLLTREAFHEEGENQHNCVERLYMNKVVDNQTYVVAIRRIDAPEKSVITCEVGVGGTIIQYLTFANRTPTDEQQIEFKALYQKHLRDSMVAQ